MSKGSHLKVESKQESLILAAQSFLSMKIAQQFKQIIKKF